MIKVIRMSHDGMRARVQLDDGDFSAWFCLGVGAWLKVNTRALGRGAL